MLPCGILDSVEANDTIANLNAGFGGGSVRQHPADDCGLVQYRRIFVVHHVNDGQQADGEQIFMERAGDGDQEAMPARMRQELPGIAGALIHGILAAHFHVAAERNGADAVVGVAAAEAEQALAKSDGENLDAHAQQLGDRVMAEFMDQNHESQDHRQPRAQL